MIKYFPMRKLLITALMLLAPLYAAKKAINPPELASNAGIPSGVYSPGILVDGTLYISGQIGTDPKTNQIPADFEAEVRTTFGRIGAVLKAAGMTFDDVVSVQVFLTDMDLFARMNAVYTGFFKDPRPARATVGVTKLASPAAHIEISVIARK